MTNETKSGNHDYLTTQTNVFYFHFPYILKKVVTKVLFNYVKYELKSSERLNTRIFYCLRRISMGDIFISNQTDQAQNIPRRIIHPDFESFAIAIYHNVFLHFQNKTCERIKKSRAVRNTWPTPPESQRTPMHYCSLIFSSVFLSICHDKALLKLRVLFLRVTLIRITPTPKFPAIFGTCHSGLPKGNGLAVAELALRCHFTQLNLLRVRKFKSLFQPFLYLSFKLLHFAFSPNKKNIFEEVNSRFDSSLKPFDIAN